MDYNQFADPLGAVTFHVLNNANAPGDVEQVDASTAAATPTSADTRDATTRPVLDWIFWYPVEFGAVAFGLFGALLAGRSWLLVITLVALAAVLVQDVKRSISNRRTKRAPRQEAQAAPAAEGVAVRPPRDRAPRA